MFIRCLATAWKLNSNLSSFHAVVFVDFTQFNDGNVYVRIISCRIIINSTSNVERQNCEQSVSFWLD